ncbi:MAG: adenylate/guanylate cyclase domain-containing protein [Chloroflexi bacterium]|nr:adenylate/guanylate cyclase domain-containing protein [Chloroflexota bacterium]
MADCRNYTWLVRALGVEKVVPAVDSFFRAAFDIFVENDGIVDKFMGDACMAFFNVPIRHPDHVARALSAAMRLQEAVQRLNDERRAQVTLEVGIGVSTGFAVAGRIGSNQPTDYTVVGEVVNMAARLQEQAGPREIVVTQDVYEAVLGTVPSARRQEYQLKGINEPVIAYVLS